MVCSSRESCLTEGMTAPLVMPGDPQPCSGATPEKAGITLNISCFPVPLTTSLMELLPLAHHQHVQPPLSLPLFLSVPAPSNPLLQTHLGLSRAFLAFGAVFSNTRHRPDLKTSPERVCQKLACLGAVLGFRSSCPVPWQSTGQERSRGVVSFLT